MTERSAMAVGRTDTPLISSALYCARVLCRVRRRAQTYALSLNDDHGDAAEAGSASPPCSGKPEGLQAFPLEPRVQGRLARIVMAEDASFQSTRARAPVAALSAPTRQQPCIQALP